MWPPNPASAPNYAVKAGLAEQILIRRRSNLPALPREISPGAFI